MERLGTFHYIIIRECKGMTSTELKHQAKLQKWAAAIQDCRSSGLSVRQWCRQESIHPTTYYRWERELLSLADTERESSRESAVTFAKIPAPQQPFRTDAERIATIRIGDASIEIYDQVNSELLKALVEALRLC